MWVGCGVSCQQHELEGHTRGRRKCEAHEPHLRFWVCFIWAWHLLIFESRRGPFFLSFVRACALFYSCRCIAWFAEFWAGRNGDSALLLGRSTVRLSGGLAPCFGHIAPCRCSCLRMVGLEVVHTRLVFGRQSRQIRLHRELSSALTPRVMHHALLENMPSS